MLDINAVWAIIVIWVGRIDLMVISFKHVVRLVVVHGIGGVLMVGVEKIMVLIMVHMLLTEQIADAMK